MEREREILRYAYTQSPFYQSVLDRAELSVGTLIEDWMKVPVVDRKQMSCANESVIPVSFYGSPEEDSMMFSYSVGSNGLCLEVVWGLRDMNASMAPLWEWRKKFYGIEPRDRSCHFNLFPGTGNDIVQGGEYYKPNLGFSLLDLDPHRLADIYRSICAHRPKWLLMQPSVALLIADYISRNSLTPIESLKYIELTGEMLADGERKYIQDMFCCRVINLYGCMEMNAIAYECPEGHLHLMEDNVFVEIMEEGEVLFDGQEGDIVITSLCNVTMPFVRYRTGDRGRIIPKKCACGHPGRVLELTRARKSEFIQTKGYRGIPAYEFSYAIQRVVENMGVGVLQMQVEQTGYFSYIISLVMKDKKILKDEYMQEEIVRIFKENLVHSRLRNAIFTFRFRDKFLTGNENSPRTFWSFSKDEDDN